MDKIKRKYIILIMAFILLFGISGTFAWFVFRSNNNAIVNTNVCTSQIFFVEGSTINGSNLKPVLTKEEGLSNSIEVATFPSNLATSFFVWELYKSGVNTAVATGNFEGKHKGDIISLATNEEVTATPITYTLYIYINGNLDNPSTMG